MMHLPTESATRGEAGVAGRRRAIERSNDRFASRRIASRASDRGDSIDRFVRTRSPRFRLIEISKDDDGRARDDDDDDAGW